MALRMRDGLHLARKLRSEMLTEHLRGTECGSEHEL